MTAATITPLTAANYAIPAATVVMSAARMAEDRDAWLELRRTGVTATDARVLAGHGYSGETVFGRWQEKVDFPAADDAPDVERDADEDLSLQLGNDIEPIIEKYAERHLGVAMRRVGMLRNRAHPHLLASPDRLTSDGGLAEFKHTSTWYLRTYQDHDSPWTNRAGWTLPPAWLTQCLHQLLVSGRSHVWVCALIAEDRRMTYWAVHQDELEQAVLAELAGTFWAHVKTATPPPITWDTVTAAEVKARYPQAKTESVTVEDPSVIQALIADRAAYKARIKDLTVDLDQVENRLRVAAGDAAEVLAPSGERLFRYSLATRRTVDYKRMAADLLPDVDVTPYTTVTPYRSLGGFPKAAK
ncbi:YqaJ viral recombinase family protein [Nakamurella leprariae]|uniref:YqaJ viral recombinase family protein n=1 Tax=Nakamurella leprariae TaxID=2803911 RepID=A0A938YG78_9ACTN|nr:YqaJ viral recombinase family protein [Nakamurella leprariae]MBM9467240.1 YqaJ viral recombinase family protein [Nakamurella leprariae]